SPLEKTLALGTYEGNVVFLDAETLETIRVLKLHQSNVKSLAFSSDGKILATASWDRTVKFVDVQTGEITGDLRGHFAGIHELFFSPDGKTLGTASADFTINLWNAEAVSKSNALLTNANISASNTDGSELFTLSNSNGNLVRWRVSDKKFLWTTAVGFKGFAMDFSPVSNSLAIGENDGTISIFDAKSGVPKQKSTAHSRTIFALKFSPDGRRIFIAYEDGLLKAFDAENLAEIFSVQAHKELFKGLDATEKFIVTGGNDNLVKIIESETGKIVFTLEGNTKPLYKTLFAPDGKTIVATGADDTARIWNLADGKLLKTLSGMSGGIFAVTFSPDGKRLATASDVGVIRLWNTETGEQVLAFTATQKQIIALKFTADGNTLISTDINGKVNFWFGKF
nr:WD40 repeat domain-containing protein [Pyrinomonadaceae bacterium]